MAPRGESRSRGEVNEINNQLEQLSTLSGTRPDVVQLKRECFQVRLDAGQRPACLLQQDPTTPPSPLLFQPTCLLRFCRS